MRSHRSRIESLEADEALGTEPAPVVVMTDLDLDDPRLAPLIARAQAEGRALVTPWEDGPGDELADTSAPGYTAPPLTVAPAPDDSGR